MALVRIKNIRGSFSKQYRNARTVDFLKVRLVEAIYIVAHIIVVLWAKLWRYVET